MGKAIVLLIVTARTLRAQDSTSVRRDTALLAPIVVTANRDPGAVARIPSATSVFDARPLLRGHPAVQLSEVLQAVPGLLVSDRFDPAQDEALSIRGFGARAAFGVRGVVVLLDGIPQTLPDGQSQLTNVDLSDVTRIEVLRGAAAALYGNGAGGVVSLSTQVPTPSDAVARGSSGVGAFGMAKLEAGVTAPLGATGVQFSGSRITSDGYRAHSAADLRRVDIHTTTPLAATASLAVTVNLAEAPKLEDPGALTRSEVDSDPQMASPRSAAVNAGKDVSQDEAGVTIEQRGSGDASTVLTAYALRRRLHNPIPATIIDLGRWAGGLRFQRTMPWTIARLAARITVGLDAAEQRDDRQNRSLSDTLTLNQLEYVAGFGSFARASVQLTGGVGLTAGVRYDRITFRAHDRLLSNGDQSGHRVLAAPSGSIGITAAVSSAVTAFADIGTSFETPTTTELANRPDGTGGFNPDLAPEHATQLEAGWRLHETWGRLGLAAYTTHVTGELIPFEVSSQPGRQFYRNAGSATHRGVEISTSVAPVHGVTIDAAYTLTDLRFDAFRTATDTLDGNAIPGVPAHAGSIALRLAPASWWLTAEVVFRSHTWANDGNTVGASGWSTTALYFGLDERLGAIELAPSLGVTNLWNTPYIANVVVNAAAGRFFEPGASRSVFGQLAVRW